MLPIFAEKIATLLKENALLAKALHFLGIKLTTLEDKTLAEVCKTNNISQALLAKTLEAAAATNQPSVDGLENYPMTLVIAYLRHAHHLYIKDRLPFLLGLVKDLRLSDFGTSVDLVKDLKVVFPLFAEDFIIHIYEEEDTLFSYIEKLNAAILNPNRLHNIWQQTRLKPIASYAQDHAHHDNDQDFDGIATLTNNFAIPKDTTTEGQILLKALEAFNQDLAIHAGIENNILFLKASALEKEVLTRQTALARQN